MGPLPLVAAGAAALFFLLNKKTAPAPVPPPLPGPPPGPNPIPPSPPPTGPVPAGAVSDAVVTTKDTGPSGALNIRNEPSTNGQVVGKAPHGSHLWIMGSLTNPDGSAVTSDQMVDPSFNVANFFYPVQIPISNITGFASAGFVSLTDTLQGGNGNLLAIHLVSS